MLNIKLKPIKNIFKRYLDFFFFCLFVFSIPLEKRHIINLENSHLGGHFIEWTAYSIYLSDILFILTIVFWLIRLIILHFEKVKYSTTLFYQKLKPNYTLYILISLILCTIISLFASDYLGIGLYRLIKMLEVFILFIYIYKTVQSYPKIFTILFTFVFSAFIQSIIAIYQFIIQKSIGLSILGEPIINPEIENVAKIVVNGEKIIRAYGTMPHANILGGYLFISIVLSISIVILLSVFKPKGGNVPRGTFLKDGEGDIKLFHVEQSPYLSILSQYSIPVVLFSLVFINIAFVLTFSYSAYIALFISPIIFFILLIILYIKDIDKLKSKVLILLKYSKYYLLLVILIIISTFIVFFPQISAKFTNIETVDNFTVVGRVEYINSAIETIIAKPEFGVGPGAFPLTFQNYLYNPDSVFFWQLNPVHNVPLLIGAELGITCLLLFILLVGWTIARSFITLYKANILRFILLSTFIVALIGIFVIMQFDHYFWTIQQGLLTFFLVLGLTSTLNTKLKKY